MLLILYADDNINKNNRISVCCDVYVGKKFNIDTDTDFLLNIFNILLMKRIYTQQRYIPSRIIQTTL